MDDASRERPPRDGASLPDVSRRSFLKGVSAAFVAGAAAAREARADDGEKEAGAPRAKVLGPGPVAIALSIDGAERKVEVEPRETLLDVLRHRLDLTGAKEVCDRGACGGCTVLLDGVPVCACMTLALDARGRAVETIEGLASGDDLHPIQRAFVERDALQCGFCTPGMIMSCVGLLRANEDPSLDEIKEGIAGNICRCGTYPRIFDAVRDAAKAAKKGSEGDGRKAKDRRWL